ncbi:MAG TPA: RDD family protein [Pyrinomonadaceae bacterium]|nr:RDD family protein [Pyrinomonadaceae bacterium]
MQCPACRAVYSNGLENCPRCKTPAQVPLPDIKTEIPSSPETAATTANDSKAAEATATASTLIEFPGTRSMPQWRKQLSERVREIQERRAREAAREMEEAAMAPPPVPSPATPETSTPPLGLVPPQPAPEMNPIVVAALRRIERARQTQPMPPVSRSRGGAAVARVAEEQYQEEINPALLAPEAQAVPEVKPVEAAPARTLVVVPAPVKEEPKPEPRRAVEVVIDDSTLARLEAESVASEELREEVFDDRAPFVARLTASAIDFLVVAFASSPFAAVIELTNGNWTDPRVAGSMGAIVLVVMFLYLTASTALAGRTWGMSLLSLRAVDADTGLQPTTKQSVLRALLYMVSLFALGLGVIYALFDAEGRTAHDHFSGTAVVQE